jgi:hypothetical protein
MSSSNKRIPFDLRASIISEYITSDRSLAELAGMFNVSEGFMEKLSSEEKLVEKRLKFQNKVIDRKVARLATTHVRTLAKVSDVIDTQMNRIMDTQRKDDKKVLEPNRMKEVLTTFALLSKENRLNTDQPTDNSNITIKVEMGGNVPIISENHIINKKPDDVEVESNVIEEQPQMETSAVKEAVEVIVEGQDEDDFVFGSLE